MPIYLIFIWYSVQFIVVLRPFEYATAVYSNSGWLQVNNIYMHLLFVNTHCSSRQWHETARAKGVMVAPAREVERGSCAQVTWPPLNQSGVFVDLSIVIQSAVHLLIYLYHYFWIRTCFLSSNCTRRHHNKSLV